MFHRFTFIFIYKYKKESISSYSSFTFLAIIAYSVKLEQLVILSFVHLYFALHISASSPPKIGEEILFLVYALYIYLYVNEIIIPLAPVGYEMVIANSVLCASLDIYHLISHTHWNNQAILAVTYLNRVFRKLFGNGTCP